ncbi:CidA/LrgA family protein [Vibrio sp.]|uniref:CidA/LrgA family protein n=1 Tax=Vibrio viridaestus TaxID=2487322 RepID=A0A3N9TJ40_9VIBR|nr:CidA/LrgA family protein [Vibrio viridaestus]MDC0610314.1 CidA/LrgA family protein [Vibrio sp.]RQW64358.1 CidA/LrgA family protein [Vibrio viridaestus]
MKKVENGFLILFQVVILSVIWFAADYLVTLFHLPIPANLTGMLILLALVFCKVVNVNWLRRGATWLLAEMLLFFIPAVVAVVNHKELMEQEGLRILAVLVISTIIVIAVTSLVVERVYLLELKLARRKSNRHSHMLAKNMEH